MNTGFIIVGLAAIAALVALMRVFAGGGRQNPGLVILGLAAMVSLVAVVAIVKGVPFTGQADPKGVLLRVDQQPQDPHPRSDTTIASNIAH